MWTRSIARGLGPVAALFLLGCSSSSVVAGRRDASIDAGVDGGHDARVDARHDAGGPKGLDASNDAPGFVAADAQPDVVIDDADCVPPGTPSNANGVGGYCSPGGLQCRSELPDAALSICTADTNVPAHAWFCTVTCGDASGCGPGSAMCITTIRGQACVPAACAALLGGSVDGGASEGGPARDGGSTEDAHPDAVSDGGSSVDAPHG